MSDVILSIVIPIYNGAKHIEECLESILSQNLVQKYEVLCVDDYSTDNSREIVEKYVSIYPQFKLIRHNENRKISNTCAAGLDAAKGKFIMFIAQDDWYSADGLCDLITCSIKEDLDTLLFNYNKTNDKGEVVEQIEVFQNSSILTGKEFLFTYFDRNFHNYLLGYEWRAIFKREHLCKFNVIFPKDVYHEDTTFLFKSILYSKKIQSFNVFLYNYRVHEASISNQNKKYRHNIILDFHINTGLEMFELSQSISNEYPSYSKILHTLAINRVNGFLGKIVKSNNIERRSFFEKISTLPFRESLSLMSNINRFLCRFPVFGLLIVNCLSLIYRIQTKLK